LRQNISITPCEALEYMILDAGFSILDLKKWMPLILSSIEHPESSILPSMAQTLMPMIFSSLVPACPGWV
jgi:hypothetical protein